MEHVCSSATHPPIPRPDGGWRLPVVGDTVRHRYDCYSASVEVTVYAVDPMDDPYNPHDPNVWNYHDELMRELDVPVLKPDPNPNVYLREAGGFETTTRRARYVGSPGWSWPEQE